ncbi:MAG: hypothetical protein JNL84_08225 [Candidatus Accumulibacter sp.]|nr:hypothetical protein [Accumulibacter sp.]
MLLAQTDQFLIQFIKHQRLDSVSRLIEGLRRHFAHRVGAIAQVKKELIEFGRVGALNAGEQDARNDRRR